MCVAMSIHVFLFFVQSFDSHQNKKVERLLCKFLIPFSFYPFSIHKTITIMRTYSPSLSHLSFLPYLKTRYKYLGINKYYNIYKSKFLLYYRKTEFVMDKKTICFLFISCMLFMRFQKEVVAGSAEICKNFSNTSTDWVLLAYFLVCNSQKVTIFYWKNLCCAQSNRSRFNLLFQFLKGGF